MSKFNCCRKISWNRNMLRSVTIFLFAHVESLYYNLILITSTYCQIANFSVLLVVRTIRWLQPFHQSCDSNSEQTNMFLTHPRLHDNIHPQHLTNKETVQGHLINPNTTYGNQTVLVHDKNVS